MRFQPSSSAILTIAAVLSALGASASAQSPAPSPAAKPPTCDAAEHRQFDFWIGDWDVFGPKGNRAGSNLIRPILAGCVLEENWAGAGGMNGKSYNTWSREARRWHQTWVDGQGNLLLLDGGLVDGRMVLEGKGLTPDGKPLRQRITWSKLDGGRVRQLWESSADDGKTWSVAFDGTYVAKGQKP